MKNISSKLTPFLAGLCIGALVVATILIGWQRHCGREDLIQSTWAQAKQLSLTVKASLLFREKQDTVKILSSLSHLPSVVYAGVYDKDGKLFAEYYGKDVAPGSIEQTEIPEAGRVYFSDGYLKVSEPIIQRDEVVGKVCIWAEQ